MRGWQLAAMMVATMTTHVAPAAAEGAVPAGPGGGEDTGGVAHAARPGLPALADYHAAEDGTGLRFSIGLHRRAPFGRGSLAALRAARAGSPIYAPATAAALPPCIGIRRAAPTIAAGWTQAVDARLAFALEAGTAFDRGGGYGGALGVPRWSRIDPVARASIAWRF